MCVPKCPDDRADGCEPSQEGRDEPSSTFTCSDTRAYGPEIGACTHMVAPPRPRRLERVLERLDRRLDVGEQRLRHAALKVSPAKPSIGNTQVMKGVQDRVYKTANGSQ
jgi:hypothetical protein